MRSLPLRLVVMLVAVSPIAVVAQQAPDSTWVLARIRTTIPGQEVRFKGAILVDDQSGLQLVNSAHTPFDIAGHSAAATIILEKLEGTGNLQVQLIRMVGSDSVGVASASGPRVSAQSNRLAEWALGRR